MSKSISSVTDVLKEITVGLDSGKLKPKDAAVQIAKLVLQIEEDMAASKTNLNEKLDFLIFMQTKLITTPDEKNPVKKITGEDMFAQWKEAKKKSTDVDNCDCHCHRVRLDDGKCKCLKNCVHCRGSGEGGAGGDGFSISHVGNIEASGSNGGMPMPNSKPLPNEDEPKDN